MADKFDELKAQVERLTGVVPSAVALISGFKEKLDAAISTALAANESADLSALTEFSASLGSQTDALAAAVAANSEPAPA